MLCDDCPFNSEISKVFNVQRKDFLILIVLSIFISQTVVVDRYVKIDFSCPLEDLFLDILNSNFVWRIHLFFSGNKIHTRLEEGGRKNLLGVPRLCVSDSNVFQNTFPYIKASLLGKAM